MTAADTKGKENNPGLSSSLEFQGVHVLDMGGLSGPEQRYDNGQSDGNFGSSDGDDKKPGLAHCSRAGRRARYTLRTLSTKDWLH